MSFDEGRILLFQRDKVELDALLNEDKSLREAGIRLSESFHQEKLTELRKKLEEESAGIYSKALHNDFNVTVATRYADSKEAYGDILFKNDVRIPDVGVRSYKLVGAMKEMHLLIGCGDGSGNADFPVDKDINIDLGKRAFQAGEVKIYFHYIDDRRIIVEVFGGEEYLFSEEVRLGAGASAEKNCVDRNIHPDIEDVDISESEVPDTAKRIDSLPVGALKKDGTLDISGLVDQKLYLLAINFIKKRKYKKAEDCLRDLSDKGDQKAKELLQYLYDEVFTDDLQALITLADSCIEKNDPESLAEAEEIAGTLYEKGHPLADFILGECHISRNSDIYDTAEALNCFRRFISASSGEEAGERYLIAAHYSALIIFNDKDASLPMLREALRYALLVSEANPGDSGISGLIDKLNERIELLGRKKIRKKLIISAAAILAAAAAAFLIFRIAGSGSGISGIDPLNRSNSESGTREKSYIVTVDAANIRSGPGMDYEVVSSRENGETLAGTGNEEKASDGSWYEIYLSADRSSTGWVSAKVVSES
ncbi:SH3 domain-containing protein [Oribacterium sp. P6A1]|uniref:SH3 domain-containing protein n=1 Tax=Oribacterium sp. P6A1 TaxID=1410612 RepID=UPI0005683BB8|nr:SH3 domain-containing protein [Oribacterium sp. P6A1]